MALTRATQVCTVEEGTRRLKKATVSGGGAQRPGLCDWESGEGELEQKIEEVGVRRKAPSPDVRSPLPPRAVRSSVASAGQGDSGCGLAGAPWAPPLTPPRRRPTCSPRRRLLERCLPEARAPPRAGRTAGLAPLPTRPSCSGRTGRATGGGRPGARRPRRWTACEARGLAPGRARQA